MTRVALLWHMHQPYYVDRSTGTHILPWVRLHGLKDYWGMVALTREFPSLRVTFNLVPSLLDQLDDFARDAARDPHLELGLRSADRLTPAEAEVCLDEFFHAQHGRMIAPHARYAELYERREQARRGGPPFTVDELRDLQVWHKLVWVDPFYEDDPRVRALYQQERGFTEADKQVLREVELEILRRVAPEYRLALERGQVELSTSPFYHPILPLLCDVGVYQTTHPNWPPPDEPFAYPQDAATQLQRSVELHTRLFGRRPMGLWPSEGSVSDAMVDIVAQAGFTWMATDEEILACSRGLTFRRDSNGVVHHADALYRSYAVEGREGTAVSCGFRDHSLSDLIGFSYASWQPDDAARDFVRRIGAAAAAAEAQGVTDPTVFVILDGENAWEHFEGQGRPFLRALYRALTTEPGIHTVTMQEACASPTGRLDRLHPGSWINSDFYIWAGHADDRRAWAQLARARRTLEAMPADRAGIEAARESILVAEGSDWFWWYGDDHCSDHDRAFDELFRLHLRNVYSALGEPVPDDLLISNITTDAAVQPTSPCESLAPAIDGQDSSYFEWLGAGWFETRDTAGAMHQVSGRPRQVEGLRYGYAADGSTLYLCLVPTSPATIAGQAVVVTFPGAQRLQLVVDAAGNLSAERAPGNPVAPPEGCRAAMGSTMELQVPLKVLQTDTNGQIPIVVSLRSSAAIAAGWSAAIAGPQPVKTRRWRA